MNSEFSSLKDQDINNLKFNLVDIWGPQSEDKLAENFNLPYAPFIEKSNELDEFKEVETQVRTKQNNPYQKKTQQKYQQAQKKGVQQDEIKTGKMQRKIKKNKLIRARHNFNVRQVHFKQAVKIKTNFRPLSEMDKNIVDSTKVKNVILKELYKTGTLKEYNALFDRINVRQPKQLLNLEQYPVQSSINASDDDLIIQIQSEIASQYQQEKEKYEKYLDMVANRKRLRQEKKKQEEEAKKSEQKEGEEAEEAEESEEEEDQGAVPPPKNMKNVYMTDAFLVALMSLDNSEFPWEIGVEKQGNHMVLDKYEPEQQSYLDQVVINENGIQNSNIIPSDENDIAKNCQESTQVYRAFQNQSVEQSQNVIDYSTQRMKTQIKKDAHGDIVDSDEEYDEDEQQQEKLANTQKQLEDKNLAFRYVEINIDNQISLNIRCQIDGYCKNSQGKYDPILIRTINENKPNYSNWRSELQSRVGILDINIRQQNLCLMHKWVIQMYLSGATKIKIGHVSRHQKELNNPQKHTILRTETYTYEELQKELKIYPAESKTWKIIKHFVNYLMNDNQPDGKYLIQKPAQVQAIKFYYIDTQIASEEDMDYDYEEEEQQQQEDYDEEQ